MQAKQTLLQVFPSLKLGHRFGTAPLPPEMRMDLEGIERDALRSAQRARHGKKTPRVFNSED
jgi:hypothetical protein